ncbi:PspC domain-containing protein [Alkalibacterium thalassium]|uniref:PspC domain-containing protein n=1 Tax=Alkalibacterium thalassium TaxID=426701 RepID=UPI000B844D13
MNEGRGIVNNKRLKRSVDNRLIGGVCGGIAEHYNLPPILVRLLFLLIPAPLLFVVYM